MKYWQLNSPFTKQSSLEHIFFSVYLNIEFNFLADARHLSSHHSRDQTLPGGWCFGEGVRPRCAAVKYAWTVPRR